MTPAFLDLLRQHVSAEAYRQLPPDDLWARVRDALDETAFRVLLERVGSRVYQRCRAVLRDDHLAEEAFQDTFRDLICKRADIPSYLSAVAWAYQTATNHAKHLRRKAWRRWKRERVEPVEVAVSTAPPADDADAVNRLLADLPDRFRRPIELVYWQGLTHAETAAALGWPKGTVDSYVAQGLKRLRAGAAKCGLAVTAAALVARPATAVSEAALDRLATAAWAASVAPPAVGSCWLSWKGAAAVAAFAGLVAGGVALGWPAAPRPAVGSVTTPPAAVESLAAKNDRLFRSEVLPDLLAELAKVLPPDNPPQFVGVTTAGPRLECEFATTKPLLAAAHPLRLRLRYCTLRRVMVVEVDVLGNGKWRWVDPKRPIILDLAIPQLKLPAIDLGTGGIAAGQKAFGKLPDDDRAEVELVRLTFGEPGGEFQLPEHTRSVAGDANRLFVTTEENSLFVHTAGHWRYLGECHGWFLSVAGDRLYADGHADGAGVWCRPASGVGAGWEKVGDRPAEDWARYEISGMAVAGGRVHFTGKRRLGGLDLVWHRPLNEPAGWVRYELPVHPRLFTGAGDWLYSQGLNRTLVRRAAADPTAAWQVIGRVPDLDGDLYAAGSELWWVNRSRGPIVARPASVLNAGWDEIGHVRPPAPR